MKKTVLAAFLFVLISASLLVSGCQSPSDAQNENAAAEQAAEETGVKVYEESSVFGEFTTYTQDGEEVNQDIFAQADLTMVNIWATYCGPCIQEMPDLAEISDEYADDNFAIVGIISDVYEPENAEVQDVIDATGAKYMQLIPNQEIFDNFLRMVQAVPTTVFVNSEGMRVGDVLMGSKDKESWIKEIESRLEAVANAKENGE